MLPSFLPPRFAPALVAAAVSSLALPAATSAQCPGSSCELEHIAAGALGGSFDYFGREVSISDEVMVVGAYLEDTGGTDAGAVYVYSLQGSKWCPTVLLTASDAAAGDHFGLAVANTDDIVVVGARQADAGGLADAGRVYVYERNDQGTPADRCDDTWTEVIKLEASNKAAGDLFGAAVAVIDQPGETILVGAPSDDNAVGGNAGSVYVFRKIFGTWTQTDNLTASAGARAPGDELGRSVALSGSFAVAGAYLADGPFDAGAAYVFLRDTGGYSYLQELKASNPASQDRFGISTSISADTIFVGAYLDDAPAGDTGSAYAFERDDSGTPGDLTDDFWTETQNVLNPTPNSFDYFGFDVAVAGDRAFVGAYLDDAKGTDAGTLHVFERVGSGLASTWALERTINSSTGSASDSFGVSVAAFGDNVVAGASSDDPNGADSGSAFHLSASGFDFPAIAGDKATLARGPGDVLTLSMNTCSEFTGGFYIVLGSVSGTVPGFNALGCHVALNPTDPYFWFTLNKPGKPIAGGNGLMGGVGPLGTNGMATATFKLPAGGFGLPPNTSLSHVFAVFSGGSIAFVSKPTTSLIP